MPTRLKRKNGVKTDLFDKRRQYSGKIIPDRANPLKLFKEWFSLASKVVASEPNAMALATVDKKGKPSSRFVLLKGFDEHGFIFFTNSISRKGLELKKNPSVAALFYWHELHRQVRIEGTVTEISRKEVERYFYSRPRDSQIAAMISEQSHKLKSRKELLNKFERYLKSNNPPLCPKTWTGYRINPSSFEFWSGMPNRMHDRVSYTKTRSGWKKTRLWP